MVKTTVSKKKTAAKRSHASDLVDERVKENPAIKSAVTECPADKATIEWARNWYLSIGYRGIGEILVAKGDKVKK